MRSRQQIKDRISISGLVQMILEDPVKASESVPTVTCCVYVVTAHRRYERLPGLQSGSADDERSKNSQVPKNTVPRAKCVRLRQQRLEPGVFMLAAGVCHLAAAPITDCVRQSGGCRAPGGRKSTELRLHTADSIGTEQTHAFQQLCGFYILTWGSFANIVCRFL